MKKLVYSTIVLLFLFSLTIGEQSDAQDGYESSACTQSKTDREDLMRQAEQSKFTVRRVEFVGLTYTRDEVLRSRMVRFQNEGDLFSRSRLVQSLRNMSRLRSEIYPVRLNDVSIRLNKSEQTVDMAICFKPKRR